MHSIYRFSNYVAYFQIGRFVHVFIIDCESDTLEKRCMTADPKAGQTFVTQRIDDFRKRTLPMVKQFDDSGKLTIVSVI